MGKILKLFGNYQAKYNKILQETQYERKEKGFKLQKKSLKLNISKRDQRCKDLTDSFLNCFEHMYKDSKEKLAMARLWYFIGYEFYKLNPTALEFTWIISKYLIALKLDIIPGQEDPLLIHPSYLNSLKFYKQ